MPMTRPTLKPRARWAMAQSRCRSLRKCRPRSSATGWCRSPMKRHLPAIFREKSVVFPGNLPLSKIATLVSTATGYPVHLSPDVFIPRDALIPKTNGGNGQSAPMQPQAMAKSNVEPVYAQACNCKVGAVSARRDGKPGPRLDVRWQHHFHQPVRHQDVHDRGDPGQGVHQVDDVEGYGYVDRQSGVRWHHGRHVGQYRLVLVDHVHRTRWHVRPDCDHPVGAGKAEVAARRSRGQSTKPPGDGSRHQGSRRSHGRVARARERDLDASGRAARPYPAGRSEQFVASRRERGHRLQPHLGRPEALFRHGCFAHVVGNCNWRHRRPVRLEAGFADGRHQRHHQRPQRVRQNGSGQHPNEDDA